MINNIVFFWIYNSKKDEIQMLLVGNKFLLKNISLIVNQF